MLRCHLCKHARFLVKNETLMQFLIAFQSPVAMLSLRFKNER